MVTWRDEEDLTELVGVLNDIEEELKIGPGPFIHEVWHHCEEFRDLVNAARAVAHLEPTIGPMVDEDEGD